MTEKDVIASQDEVLEFLTNVLRGKVKEQVMSSSEKVEELPTTTRENKGC